MGGRLIFEVGKRAQNQQRICGRREELEFRALSLTKIQIQLGFKM
jgi:hypothetical protein